MPETPPLVGLCCGIFSRDLEQLYRQDVLDFPLVYVDSMLHMDPPQLEERLREELARLLADGKQVILLFGDCHARMFQHEEERHVVRLQGSNCIEILLGAERYREIRHRRSFVLLYEWTERWREIFVKEMGLDQATAHMFMPEYHDELLYLDTGINPVPVTSLEECAAYCGLPFRIERVDLTPLLEAIAEARNRLGG